MRGARRFRGLDAFLDKCRGVLASEGESAEVLLAYHGKTAAGRVRVAPGGLYAQVIGYDAEQRVTVCEVGARAFVEAAAEGRIQERGPERGRRPRS